MLLLGITGGLSFFALAGARRTQSAYPRFLRDGARVDDGGRHRPVRPATVETIASFPQVVAVAGVRRSGGRTVGAREAGVLARTSRRSRASTDASSTRTASRRRKGRLPDRKRVDEVAVNETAARTVRLPGRSGARPRHLRPERHQRGLLPASDATGAAHDRDDRRRRSVPERGAPGRHRPLAADAADARVHPSGAPIRAIRVAGSGAEARRRRHQRGQAAVPRLCRFWDAAVLLRRRRSRPSTRNRPCAHCPSRSRCSARSR